MALAPPANNAGVPIPAIAANPPSLSDITNIKNYVERLTQSKATRSEIHATDTEIGAAELYLHESVLKTSLGRAAAPPWLEAFVDTLHQIQQTVEQIEQDQKRTNAAIRNIGQDIQNIERSQRCTSAVIENMRIAKSNVELAKNTGSTSYLAKQKEVDGDGTILANGTVPNQNPLAPLATAPVVGTVFSPTIETHSLSHHIILRIVQYYNQNFNIQPGDTVPIRSQKIANWLRSEI